VFSVAMLAACGTAAMAATPLDEMTERARVVSASKEAFLTENFAELESVSAGYRRDRSRTPSGLWKLGLWHGGIDQAIDMYAELPGSQNNFRRLEQIAERWLKSYPDSPGAVLTLSRIHIAHGWKIRGGKYASEVSKSAWKPFHTYIKLARQNLEERKASAAVDPAWYAQMLTIARAQSWERAEFDRLLDEALDREPQFYPNYFMALEYLLPKWGGSDVEIDLFAREAVRRTSKIEGKGMYARIYWFASQTEFDRDLFGKSKVEWPLMKAGFEDIIARYPDAWNLNNFAKFACLAKDQSKTRMLLRKIGEKRVPQAWDSPGLWETCAAFALKALPNPVPQLN
jgi:hypothetical protein